ncbi:MAG: hypothetical protein IKT52_06155 [Oscillospiraceae bacterium]|nr:hypothetical protein [Oscillospiraceae bacterium]
MKSKAPLFLMEQLVMLLVFALAAALCLSVFARVNAISLQIVRRDEAVLLAQNAAELLQATGDPEAVENIGEDSGFFLRVIEEDSKITGLCQAKIVVFYEDEEVFSLRTGWQEVGK